MVSRPGERCDDASWGHEGVDEVDVEPAAPAPADPITAFVRGGPPASFAGIYVARIDDLSFDRFLLFGALDTFGEWAVADVTPDGLTGLTYSLRAYSVGFDGKLAKSTEVELTFQ